MTTAERYALFREVPEARARYRAELYDILSQHRRAVEGVYAAACSELERSGTPKAFQGEEERQFHEADTEMNEHLDALRKSVYPADSYSCWGCAKIGKLADLPDADKLCPNCR